MGPGDRLGRHQAERLIFFARNVTMHEGLMPKKIRRVVTGHNAAGKSIFCMDGPSPHVFSRGTGTAWL